MLTSAPPGQSSTATANIRPTYLWFICAVAALGGLLFGYDWVVIGGAAKFYEAFFHLQDTAANIPADAAFWTKLRLNAVSPVGWAQSCALLGCLAGALGSGWASDRFGRKPVLILSALNFVISSVGIALSQSFSAFVIWRILGGVSIGLASNISPMYISEIAPAQRRGLLVAINQLTIVVGVLAAQIVNWLIAQPVPDTLSNQLATLANLHGADRAAAIATYHSAMAATWNGAYGWRWMFAACAVPSILFLVGSFFVPESPRWLARARRPAHAQAVLEKIGGAAYSTAAMAEISSTLSGNAANFSLSQLFTRKMLALLSLGIFLAVFQQWCGINVIFNYASEIFTQAGFNMNDALTSIVATGAVNLAFVFVALATVDRLGRRPLMLFGAAALTLIYVALGYCYHAKAQGHAVAPAIFLALVSSAIAVYSMSLAPVTWVLISEIFPNRIRGTAMSISVGFLWIACFLLTYTFPILNALLGVSVTFWIYAVICAAGFITLLAKLPETKGRTLEQLEGELG